MKFTFQIPHFRFHIQTTFQHPLHFYASTLINHYQSWTTKYDDYMSLDEECMMLAGECTNAPRKSHLILTFHKYSEKMKEFWKIMHYF